MDARASVARVFAHSGAIERANANVGAGDGSRASRTRERGTARAHAHLSLGSGEDALVDELLGLGGGPLQEGILLGDGGDVRGVGRAKACTTARFTVRRAIPPRDMRRCAMTTDTFSRVAKSGKRVVARGSARLLVFLGNGQRNRMATSQIPRRDEKISPGRFGRRER